MLVEQKIKTLIKILKTKLTKIIQLIKSITRWKMLKMETKKIIMK